MVTERGTTFGYNDLVVDMRGLVLLRETSPVCFDATHSVQRPGGGEGRSAGDRRFVAPLARAAVAVGVDALFVEVHETPESAPCDASCQLPFAELAALLEEVSRITGALGGAPSR
jgi:2-dehydro-3-deoxyphosphooctonate aldolase (KDO 8-P synthase)